MYRIGIDIGGTFTDFAAVDDAGRVVIAKSASTPQDPSDGLLEGLTVLAGELGIDRDQGERARLDHRRQRLRGAGPVHVSVALEVAVSAVATVPSKRIRSFIRRRDGARAELARAVNVSERIHCGAGRSLPRVPWGE